MPKDMIAPFIAVAALVVSLASFYMQYRSRNSVLCRIRPGQMTVNWLDSDAQKVIKSVLLRVEILFFNRGNRQVAITGVSFRLYEEGMSDDRRLVVKDEVHIRALFPFTEEGANYIEDALMFDNVFAGSFLIENESIALKRYTLRLSGHEDLRSRSFKLRGVFRIVIVGETVKGGLIVGAKNRSFIDVVVRESYEGFREDSSDADPDLLELKPPRFSSMRANPQVHNS